jgi:hypothetical protein
MMTPEEQHLKATYEEIFRRLPLYKQRVHARVGLADPLTEEECEELEKGLSHPEILKMVFQAALALNGRPAGPELSAWLREQGLLRGPLVDTLDRLEEVEEKLRTCTQEEHAALAQEHRQLKKEEAAYRAMSDSRLDQGIRQLHENRDQAEDE